MPLNKQARNIKAVNDTHKGALIRPMMLIYSDEILQAMARFNVGVGVKVKADFAARMGSRVRASRGVYERRVIGQEINSADRAAS